MPNPYRKPGRDDDTGEHTLGARWDDRILGGLMIGSLCHVWSSRSRLTNGSGPRRRSPRLPLASAC